MLFLLILQLIGWFRSIHGYGEFGSFLNTVFCFFLLVCSKTWDMNEQFFKQNPEYVMFGLKWQYHWRGRSTLEIFAQNQHRVYTSIRRLIIFYFLIFNFSISIILWGVATCGIILMMSICYDFWCTIFWGDAALY